MIAQPKAAKKEATAPEAKPKAFVAQENLAAVDWSAEFDDEPVTYAMVSIEEVDWSSEFDEEPGYAALEERNGLGSFDWSMEDDEDLFIEDNTTGTDSDKEPVLCAMVATSPSNSAVSEVCSKCEKVYLNLLKEYET